VHLRLIIRQLKKLSPENKKVIDLY